MADLIFDTPFDTDGSMWFDSPFETQTVGAVTVSTVGSDNTFRVDQASVNVTGAGLTGAAVTLEDVDGRRQVVTVTTSSDTSLTFTPVRGNLKYGAVVVEVSNGPDVVRASVQMLPQAGWGFVILTTGFSTEPGSILLNWQGTQPPQVGDVVPYTLESTGGDAVTIGTDAIIHTTGNAVDDSFQADLHSEGIYQGVVTVLVENPDIVVEPEPNTAPVIAAIGNQRVAQGEVQLVTVVVSDAQGHPVTLSLGSLHAGTGVSLSGGVLTLAPTALDRAASPFPVTVIATDSLGAASQVSFTLTVDALPVARSTRSPLFSPLLQPLISSLVR